MGRNTDKLAYIFGNDCYQELNPLRGAINDADLVDKTLKECGFKTCKYTDLKYTDFHKRIKDFQDKCNENRVCLFYYAGHGFECQGNNYLCPVDARENQIEKTSINISDLVNEVSMNRDFVCIVILDCCRNICNDRGINERNPIIANFKNRGGTFVAYATSSGRSAMECNGNGVYTKLLCEHISKDNKPIEQIFKDVRKEMVNDNGSKQISWEYSSLVEEFYFKETKAGSETIPFVAEIVNKAYSFEEVKKYVEEDCDKSGFKDVKAALFNVLNAIDNYLGEDK